MYKFRSMSDEWDENGNLLPDDVRLDKFGKALRATFLDELPEAFNILKGEIVITLAEWKAPDASRSNEEWEKEYKKQFGTERSFF